MDTGHVPILRPLGMGQLLDQAVRFYRHNFLKFVGIIAVVQIPLTLLGLLASLATLGGLTRLGRPGAGGFLALGIVGSFLLVILTYLLVHGVATAALTRAVADQYIGASTSLLDTYRRIRPVWLKLIGAIMLTSVIALLLVVWSMVPCIGWFTGSGMLVFLIAVVMPLAAPVIVLENQGPIEALQRAWELVRRRFWWVSGFAAVLYLFNLLIVSGPTALVNFVAPLLLNDWVGSAGSFAFIAQALAQSLGPLVFTLLYLPLQLTAITLLYFDLRIRTEGLDLTLLAESALQDQPDVSAIMAQAPPPVGGWPLTWQDVGYFAALSVGVSIAFVILYVGLFAILSALAPMLFGY